MNKAVCHNFYVGLLHLVKFCLSTHLNHSRFSHTPMTEMSIISFDFHKWVGMPLEFRMPLSFLQCIKQSFTIQEYLATNSNGAKVRDRFQIFLREPKMKSDLMSKSGEMVLVEEDRYLKNKDK